MDGGVGSLGLHLSLYVEIGFLLNRGTIKQRAAEGLRLRFTGETP